VGYNEARLRRLNEARTNPRGAYVLYWMQASRRLQRNHALDYALLCAAQHAKPLVVYEGLRLDYPWASRRLHRFVLEGMRDNAAAAKATGFTYWPFVEGPERPARGLVAALSRRAALVVTDDFPCFVVPDQTAALVRRAEVPVFAVDSCSVVPLSLLGPPVAAAAHLRPRIHRAFAEAWAHRAAARPAPPKARGRGLEPPLQPWDPASLEPTLASLSFRSDVPPVAGAPGGSRAARKRLREFVTRRLPGYAEARSVPQSPSDGHASGLSPYLHFGHVSIEEVVGAALSSSGRWTPHELRLDNRGKREGFFHDDPDVNAFLDEALVWRDVGHHWHVTRRRDTESLDRALPAWALATLRAHAADRRAYVYPPEAWEAAETHDPLWNAAQRELVATGTIHNYLRMLWGKKVLEWSRTPEEAYATLVHLNNKYALDGRDPNSWTGILWCFGLFDRPWAPERPVLGVLRYMSSENTARKFDLRPYLEYVDGLPSVAEARGKTTTLLPRRQSSSPSTNQASRSRSRKIR
jgi:deoxyribodipyrimidine photo-lyase